MPNDVVTMDKIVSLCKRRGFIFPASEIYGGIANTYDYGHYGVLLKQNVVNQWWKAMIQDRDDIVALDSAIIQHPRDVGGERPPRRLHRPARAVPRQVQAALPRGPPARGGRGARRAHRPPRLPGLRRRAVRAARVQPDVRDDDRPGEGGGLDRLPAARDRAGHLPRLQAGAPVRAPQAAVRDRAGRQVVPQRDHARQLHLPHARVRADGDGVLRPARRGRAVVRALDEGALRLVRAARDRPREPAPARARRRRAVALLVRHERRRVPVPDTAGRSSRASPTAATSTSPSTRSSRARSSTGSTRRPATATSRT